MVSPEKTGDRKTEKLKSIPESVNSEEDSRVETSMVDDLGLGHLQGLGHPVEEGKVSGEVEIYELADEVPPPAGARPCPSEVPFGEVNPVVDWLNSEQSEGQKESKGGQDVYER